MDVFAILEGVLVSVYACVCVCVYVKRNKGVEWLMLLEKMRKGNGKSGW